MLDWSDYLKRVIDTKTVLDGLSLSCDEETLHISPIVKASILMLEDMTTNQGNHNIFVCPVLSYTSQEHS